MRYRQIDIRKKILIPIVLISFAGVVLTLVLTLFLMDIQSNEATKHELMETNFAVQEEFENQEHHLMAETILLSSSPTIKEAVESGDRSTLKKELSPARAAFHVDSITVLNAKSTELIRLGDSIPITEDLVSVGINLGRTVLFARSNNTVWLTSVAPVHLRDGKLVGLMVIGNKVGKTFFAKLKRETGAEIALEYNNLFIGSSTSIADVAIKDSFKENLIGDSSSTEQPMERYNNGSLARVPIETMGKNKATAYIMLSTIKDDHIRRNNALIILIVNLAALLLSIIVAYIVGNNITKPLKLMSEKARMIAGGDYRQRIAYADVREIDDLATSFNVMSEALDKNRQQLEERAYTDGLTSLYNHRYFQDTLSDEVARAERYKHPLSLVIIDIDNFKKVNDNFGHKVGDDALKYIAERIKSSIREIDIACRMGGEEFAIILPETTRNEAFTVAERLRQDISSEPIENIGRITVSLGVATYPEHATNKDSLIISADSAMYHAKRNGKNRTIVYNDESLHKTHLGDDRWMIEESYCLDTYFTLISSMENKNQSASHHSENVKAIAELIGFELGLAQAEIEHLGIAGFLHDIGKVIIPEPILNKTEPLTDEDFQKLMQHPIVGEQMLSLIKIEEVTKAVLYHHERVDGSGYPHGLKGDSIPLYARIIAVADSFEVMITGRQYQEMSSTEMAIEELKKESGTKYDAHVVDALVRVFERNELEKVISKNNPEANQKTA